MTKKKTSNVIIFCILCLLVVAFLTPIFFVLINSFKGKLFISNNPFALPTAETFVGLTNYVNGIEKTGFFTAFGWSAFITVFSVAAIILFTSMTAYYLTRVKTGVTNVLYYMFVFSMIVPFQMVMFTMSKLANMTHLNNPPGMVLAVSGIWFRPVRVHVLWIHQIDSAGHRRGSHDRRLQPFADLLRCRNADPKADCHHRSHSECHVDLERLSAALSGNRPEY